MNNIFDSHGHYNDAAFNDDRDSLLNKLFKKGVEFIVNVGAAMEDTSVIIELVRKYEGIYGALGVHPENADKISEDFIYNLEQNILSEPKIKAVGEIGLDYHYDGYSKEIQKKIFTAQLDLAKKINMPVIIHSRDACEDTMEILREYKPNGVMHCFSYCAETAEEIINLGMYISFTGVLTFKNARKALRALERVPLNKLMLETDCPYMAPEPFRGQRCSSDMIEKTAEKAAEIYGISTEEMLYVTLTNAKKFYGIN